MHTRNITIFYNSAEGTDFQPLIADFNHDGLNEVAIFSKNYLRIYNAKFQILDYKDLGLLKGDAFAGNVDNDPYIEIIAIVKSGNFYYFYEIEYSNKLYVKSNLSITNASGSGINCFYKDNINKCIFIDNYNDINIIDMSNKSLTSFSMNDKFSITNRTPSISDFDNDGNMEAAFVYDHDGNGKFGVLVFDLKSNTPDKGFNGNGFIDNIDETVFNPAFIDGNKDGKKELVIGSLKFFSIHEISLVSLYSYNGSEICNYNSGSEYFLSETPVLADCDGNGLKDDLYSVFSEDFTDSSNKIQCRKANNCTLVASKFTHSYQIPGKYYSADMDGNGDDEIITSKGVFDFSTNNSKPIVLLSYDLGSKAPIPFDLDKNGALDLIWSKFGKTKFFIDDTGNFNVNDFKINPKNPSTEEDLICSWKIVGDGNLFANISLYKNNILNFTQSYIPCSNNSYCLSPVIKSSLTEENDIWSCDIKAFSDNNMNYESVYSILLPSPRTWKQSRNNLASFALSSGVGNFPTGNSFNLSNSSYGTIYEPRVGDIDFNNENEIIIFHNNSIKILDENLKLIAKNSIGKLRSHPVLFNSDNDSYLEIIFISRLDNLDYLIELQYNGSKFFSDFNFSLHNSGENANLRCFDFNGKKCIFLSSNNDIFIANLDNNSYSNYSLNNYVDLSEKAPALSDFDNDGNMEIVSVYDNDGDGSRGILVFDIDEMSIDKKFNSGFIDDIDEVVYSPIFLNADNFGDNEIVVSSLATNSLYYQGKISVYNSDGKEICSHYPSNEGLFLVESPVVMDCDKDGLNDDLLAAYTNFKWNSIAIFSCIRAEDCYVIQRGFNTNFEGKFSEKYYSADMNNDGVNDIVTSHGIFNLSTGKSLHHYSFSGNSLPVDMDGNGALDIIQTNENIIKILYDKNEYFYDLEIKPEDISFTKNKINVNVHNNGNKKADNVPILIVNAETLENKTASLSIDALSSASIYFEFALKENDEFAVFVDYENTIKEKFEDNNFAMRIFEPFPSVFLSVDLEFPVENEFKEFFKDKLDFGYYSDDENNADVKLYIGKDNLLNKQKLAFTRDNFGFWYDAGNVYYNELIGTKPYNGIIGGYKENGIIYILIYGNSVEGEISAVKEFIEKQNIFFNLDEAEVFFVSDENEIAVRIFDFLHNSGNEPNYGKDNEAFRHIVRNALRDEMFAQKDYSVFGDSGIRLRLRNLKPNASEIYLSYLNSSILVEVPVVLAHGLFSNLTTWEVLGSEIANAGRDTWLIEITGGPGQDCDDCIDYSFYNLTDIFVPALLNGVLNFTGKSNLQYVGFSNGCRSALDSLERGMFDSSKIETFVAVGCPGAFEGESFLGKIIASRNRDISKTLNSKNIYHPSVNQIIKNGLFDQNYLSKNQEPKISLNLFKFWENIIIDKNDNQPGNIQVANFVIIQGSALTTDDGLITVNDESSIYQNVNNTNLKQHFDIFALHTGLDDNNRANSIIKKSINKQDLSFYEKTINLINKSQ